MNENQNSNFSGNGSTGSNGNSEGSEYRYVRENIPHASEEVSHRPYVDANYREDNSANTQSSETYTSPEGKKAKPPKQKMAPEKKKKIWRFVAVCLVCALLGGAAGGGIVYACLPHSSGSGSTTLNVAQAASSKSDTGVPVVDGSVLSGSEIYTLGCQQAVGIKTEVTYTNFLGMQSSSAVSGSGFIATSDGYIITNYHVVEYAYVNKYKISVMLYNGDTYDASIVGVEEDNDIAVLKIDATGLSAATLGNSSELQVGDSVYAIGNPLGELSFSMTGGMVSALDRDITTTAENGNTTTNNMFQFDAAVNSGNSGGPVYNSRGQVVGIVTAKYENTGVEGLGFAIPIDDVKDIVDDLISNGYVSGKAYLGVTVNTVNSSVAQYYNMAEGAYVYAVADGSCCAKAGIKVGDIITAINDTEVKSSSELIAAKREYKAGDTVTLKVYRDGKYENIKVTLDEEQPNSSSDSGNSSSSGNQGDSGNQGSFGNGGSLPTIPKS